MSDVARRPRITIVQGIYQDAHGITVLARIGSGATMRQARARFPLVDADGLPYSKKNYLELLRCRLQMLEDLRGQRADERDRRETLGAAIDAFRAAHPVSRVGKYADYRSLLQAWRATPLADRPIAELTRQPIREQLEAWTEAGVAPSTINHRKRALGAVLREALGAIDDPDIVVPTDTITTLPPRPAEPRGIPLPIVARILASFTRNGPKNQTAIRLTIMAWTGMAPKSLLRLERRHVQFREGRVYLPPRKKGKGAKGIWIPMLPPLIAAFHAYDRLGLWGRPYQTSALWLGWKRALARTERLLEAEAETTGDRTLLELYLVSLPPSCRPYDLRHSFLTDVYRTHGDIRAAQAIAQHAKLTTTERYTQGAVDERVSSALEAMRVRWFPESEKPGAVATVLQLVPKKTAGHVP